MKFLSRISMSFALSFCVGSTVFSQVAYITEVHNITPFSDLQVCSKEWRTCTEQKFTKHKVTKLDPSYRVSWCKPLGVRSGKMHLKVGGKPVFWFCQGRGRGWIIDAGSEGQMRSCSKHDTAQACDHGTPISGPRIAGVNVKLRMIVEGKDKDNLKVYFKRA